LNSVLNHILANQPFNLEVMKKMDFMKFFAFVFSMFFIAGCSEDDGNEELQQHEETLTVDALLSLTGEWSTLGETSKAALEIAAEDINEYLETKNSGHQIAVSVYDTKLEPTQALEAIESAQGEGIHFVIGPQSSSEAAEIIGYANENDMIVVSHGSTAGALSIPNDNLFRFCPDGRLEGMAVAQAIYDDGIRGLVTISRNDVGNSGLQNGVEQAFTALGGSVYSLPPYPSEEVDFNNVVTDINNELTSAIATHGVAKTGVYIAAFDEAAGIFAEATKDPLLPSVRWYGGDGVVNSAALTANAEAAGFAISTDFIAPSFSLPSTAQAKWEPLIAEITARTGTEPKAFALAAYDALWVIALTYEETKGLDHDWKSMKTMFQKQADMYFGATGSTQLNDNGDRAVASFGFWGIEEDNGTYVWVWKRTLAP
jgi:branched-chain amino acid transport system substrate-binding protein